jgi:hypothetical protein
MVKGVVANEGGDVESKFQGITDKKVCILAEIKNGLNHDFTACWYPAHNQLADCQAQPQAV